MILMKSNRKKWKLEETKKKMIYRQKVFSDETHPNWFCKTGYAVLSPAAAAANGNPGRKKAKNVVNLNGKRFFMQIDL